MDTGWPPAELLVTVITITPMLAAPRSAISCSRAFHVHVALEGV